MNPIPACISYTGMKLVHWGDILDNKKRMWDPDICVYPNPYLRGLIATSEKNRDVGPYVDVLGRTELGVYANMVVLGSNTISLSITGETAKICNYLLQTTMCSRASRLWMEP
eukprot:2062715-Ditylum_brightwellii.AAC.2